MKKEQTYVRNTEQLARAFGLPLSPRKRKASLTTARQWTETAGFPAKTPKGWVIEQVRAFLAKSDPVGRVPSPGAGSTSNQSDLPVSPAAAAPTKALLDLWEDMMRNPTRHEDKIQKWQLEWLKKDRPNLFSTVTATAQPDTAPPASLLPGPTIPPRPWQVALPPGEGKVASGAATEGESSNPQSAIRNPQSEGTADNPVMVIPKTLGTQADLARFLHEYFKRKISITISPQTIQHWREGTRLRSVYITGEAPDNSAIRNPQSAMGRWVRPPPFPAKNASSGFQWDVHECIEWVEKWIVPVHGGSATGQLGEFEAAVDFDTARQEHDLWKMRRERAIADGTYKSVETFQRDCLAIGQTINAAIAHAAEVILQTELEKAIDGLFEDQRLESPGDGNSEQSAIRNPQSAIEMKWHFLDAVRSGCRKAADELRKMITAALATVGDEE